MRKPLTNQGFLHKIIAEYGKNCDGDSRLITKASENRGGCDPGVSRVRGRSLLSCKAETQVGDAGFPPLTGTCIGAHIFAPVDVIGGIANCLLWRSSFYRTDAFLFYGAQFGNTTKKQTRVDGGAAAWI